MFNNKYTVVYIVAFLFIAAFVCCFSFLRKLYIKKKIKEEYSKIPQRKYDDRDFAYIRQYFDICPPNGGGLDNATWNDLQMPNIYKNINNSMSSIGDEYLFRHLRLQEYKDLNRLESHIDYLDKNEKERLDYQYAFCYINKKMQTERVSNVKYDRFSNRPNNLIKYIKDNSFFPKVSIKGPVFMLFLTLLTLVPIFILKMSLNNIIFYLMTAFLIIFIASTIVYSIFMQKAGYTIYHLSMFVKSINAAKVIINKNNKLFSKEVDELKSAVNKINLKTQILNFMLNTTMTQSTSSGIISIILMPLGLYAFTYMWAIKFFNQSNKEMSVVYDNIGYFELCINIASFRHTLHYYCQPQFTDSKNIDFKHIYHPLLKKPVDNSKTISQRAIITGANASGKSTFAKTLAINAITGQTINTCFAKEFILKPAYVYSSMNVEDDILTGDSFYMAEIKRLKIMESLSQQPDTYEMFFLDEILKGTNTIDRIAASSTILKSMANDNCFICLTTHDIELTDILSNYYKNYHFKEHTTDNSITYDYKLYDGVTTGSNAIALLRVCHFDDSIVNTAKKSAEDFRHTGIWKKLS